MTTSEYLRCRRVTLLLLGIIVLSGADLALTLLHLQTMGMMEANPIAAWLIRSTQSSLALTIFKSASVGVSVSMLYAIRRHLGGEIGAWCGAAILVVLCVMWGRYAAELDDDHAVQLAQSGAYAEHWLVLE